MATASSLLMMRDEAPQANSRGQPTPIGNTGGESCPGRWEKPDWLSDVPHAQPSSMSLETRRGASTHRVEGRLAEKLAGHSREGRLHSVASALVVHKCAAVTKSVATTSAAQRRFGA